jgi:uncharacterized phage protein (TIGR02218 family)
MIELYTFTFPDTIYRYTSAARDVVHDGNTYTARSGLLRGELSINPSGMDSQTTIAIPCTDALVRAYMQEQPAEEVTVQIVQLVGGTASTWFTGVIGALAISGVRAEIRLTGHGITRLSAGPAMRYQAQCRHALYGAACGVDREDHKVSGTLSALESGSMVLVSANFEGQTWKGGAIKIGSQWRTVIADPAANKVRLSRPFVGLEGTEAFDVFKGCDKSYSTCRTTFNNLANFGGIPTLPAQNPFSKSIETAFDLPTGS